MPTEESVISKWIASRFRLRTLAITATTTLVVGMSLVLVSSAGAATPTCPYPTDVSLTQEPGQGPPPVVATLHGQYAYGSVLAGDPPFAPGPITIGWGDGSTETVDSATCAGVIGAGVLVTQTYYPLDGIQHTYTSAARANVSGAVTAAVGCRFVTPDDCLGGFQFAVFIGSPATTPTTTTVAPTTTTVPPTTTTVPPTTTTVPPITTTTAPTTTTTIPPTTTTAPPTTTTVPPTTTTVPPTTTTTTTTTEPQTTASPIPGPPVPPRPRVVNRPDISVRLAAPRQAAAGSVQVVTVTVSNVGTALAAASSTSLSFSGGLTLVDAGGGTATDGGVEFATPALRPGKDVVFQVKIRADRAGIEVLYVVDPPQANERNAANNFAVTVARIR